MKNKKKKQVEDLEVLAIQHAIPENKSSEEAKNELNKIKETEKTGDREKLYYKTHKDTCIFQNFWTTVTFVRDIYNTITKKEADEDQSELFVEILNFRKQVKPKNTLKKQQE